MERGRERCDYVDLEKDDSGDLRRGRVGGGCHVERGGIGCDFLDLLALCKGEGSLSGLYQ